MTTRHDTVILDVDGTLADSTYHHALAWARAFDRVGRPQPMWRLHRAIGMGGDKLVAAVAGEEAEREHGDALRAAWEEEFTAHVMDLLDLPEGTLAGRVSSDEAEQSKPAPDLLALALERVGGRSALVVGDTTYDVAAAGRLGAPCVTVRTGGFGVAELEQAGAVLVVETPADLVDADWDRLLSAPVPHPGDSSSSSGISDDVQRDPA